MAQGIGGSEHGKARYGLNLAFLVLATFLALVLTSGGHQRSLAFVSPQSPLVPADQDRSLLVLPVVNAAGTDSGWLGSVWRARVGAGLIVLGMALVIGGLVWITSSGTPAVPEPPDETGSRAL